MHTRFNGMIMFYQINTHTLKQLLDETYMTYFIGHELAYILTVVSDIITQTYAHNIHSGDNYHDIVLTGLGTDVNSLSLSLSPPPD